MTQKDLSLSVLRGILSSAVSRGSVRTHKTHLRQMPVGTDLQTPPSAAEWYSHQVLITRLPLSSSNLILTLIFQENVKLD